MGLETVEMIIKLETHFKIDIPDKDASKLDTPNKIIDYIVNKLRANDDPALSYDLQKAFYIIRNYIVNNFNIPRNSVEPKTLFSEIIKKDPKQYFNQMKSDLDFFSYPTLMPPDWFRRIAFYPCMVLLLIILIFLVNGGISMVSFLAMVILSFYSIIIFTITPYFETNIFPADYTIGDLAKCLNIENYKDSLDGKEKTITIQTIQKDCIAIISDTLGIRPNFSLDANFYSDLGAG